MQSLLTAWKTTKLSRAAKECHQKQAAVGRWQYGAWGAILACFGLVGCQSLHTSPSNYQDLAARTRGLAAASASGDPAMCPDGTSAPGAERPPAELDKMSLPTYRIEPPDVLLLGLINTVPKDPYFLRTLDILQIYVAGTPEEQPIAGEYQVQPDGTLNLGPSYGSVAVKGLTLVETRDAISRQLASTGYGGSEISVYLREPSGLQQLAGEKIVGPDGMVNLGIYGNVYVTGMTLIEARAAIEEKLSEYFERPKLSLDIFAYNSKTYYIITEGGGFGDQVLRLPASGNETVLDAIASVGGLTQLSSKRLWISRPAPVGSGCDQILTVDWDAITRGASTSTNYQILPGDRVFIAEDRLFAASTFVNRMLDPVERIFGFTLLGAQAVQSTQRFPAGF